jgi:hypothetical protein
MSALFSASLAAVKEAEGTLVALRPRLTAADLAESSLDAFIGLTLCLAYIL